MSIFHALLAVLAATFELVLYLISWLLFALLAVYGLARQIILHAVVLPRGSWGLPSTVRVDLGAQARDLDSGEARGVVSY